MKKTDIGRAASELTKEQFGEEISTHVGLTKDEIDRLFQQESDRKELATLLDIVINSADENEQRARLIDNISKVAGTVLRLLGKIGMA